MTERKYHFIVHTCRPPIHTRHAPTRAASRSILLETEPKLFVFETSYYAFCGRYCFESVASKIK